MSNKAMTIAIGLSLLLGGLAVGCGAKLNENTEKHLASALEAKKSDFKSCYEKALEKDRGVKGEMQLVLDVHYETGKVTKAEVKKSAIKDAGMKKCVAKAAKKIELPEPPNVYVEGHYTLVFRFEK